MVESWIILDFFTIFILALIIVFQNSGSRLKTGRMYMNIIYSTFILTIADVLSRTFENMGGIFIIVAFLANLAMFALDPLVILFSVSYMDCWMDEKNKNMRVFFRRVIQLYVLINMILVLVDQIFRLRWFFYFDRGVYYRGQFFMARALTMEIFMIMTSVYLAVFRKNVHSDYRRTLFILPAFAIIGSILQVFNIGMNTTYAGGTLGCLVLFISIQINDVNVDFLTGVLNRRGLDIKLQDRIRGSLANNECFCGLLFDIEHFKEINDKLGHVEGDNAIQALGDILVDTFGDNAHIGRLGGNEFCVLTENTSEPDLKGFIRKVNHYMDMVKKKSGWDSNVEINSIYVVYDPAEALEMAEYAKRLGDHLRAKKQEHYT